MLFLDSMYSLHRLLTSNIKAALLPTAFHESKVFCIAFLVEYLIARFRLNPYFFLILPDFRFLYFNQHEMPNFEPRVAII